MQGGGGGEEGEEANYVLVEGVEDGWWCALHAAAAASSPQQLRGSWARAAAVSLNCCLPHLGNHNIILKYSPRVSPNVPLCSILSLEMTAAVVYFAHQVTTTFIRNLHSFLTVATTTTTTSNSYLTV